MYGDFNIIKNVLLVEGGGIKAKEEKSSQNDDTKPIPIDLWDLPETFLFSLYLYTSSIGIQY